MVCSLVPRRQKAGGYRTYLLEMCKSLSYGATRDKLMQATLEALGGTPEQFADLVRQDSEKYARLAKQLNIKAE